MPHLVKCKSFTACSDICTVYVTNNGYSFHFFIQASVYLNRQHLQLLFQSTFAVARKLVFRSRLCRFSAWISSETSSRSPPRQKSRHQLLTCESWVCLLLSGVHSNFSTCYCAMCLLTFQIVEDQFTCPRSDTVQKLANMLDKHQVVLIRGTPSSGKTTLAILLDYHYQRKNVPSILVSSWPKGGYGVYTNVLIEHAMARGHTGITNENIGLCDIVIIVDEAQMSYHDTSFWLGFVKTQNGRRGGPRVCLLCSYGSPTGGVTDMEAGSPVGFIGLQKRVSLTVSKIPYAPTISLFYDRREFDDVVRRLCADIRCPTPLDDSAQDYIFIYYEWTSGGSRRHHLRIRTGQSYHGLPKIASLC